MGRNRTRGWTATSFSSGGDGSCSLDCRESSAHDRNERQRNRASTQGCKQEKEAVFIASTSGVYRKSDRVPFREDDDLVLGAATKGRWSHAASEILHEFAALSYWRKRSCPFWRDFSISSVPGNPAATGWCCAQLSQVMLGTHVTVFDTGLRRMPIRVPLLEEIRRLWLATTNLT